MISCSRLKALAACLCLAGCADPVPASAPSLSAPAPLHDRQAGEGRRLQERKSARPGQEIMLGAWFSLRRDCALQTYFRVTQVFPPEHGQARIVRGLYRPAYAVETGRAACDALPRDGVAAFYRPADGFTGTDTMTFRVSAPSGKSWTVDVVVTVG